MELISSPIFSPTNLFLLLFITSDMLQKVSQISYSSTETNTLKYEIKYQQQLFSSCNYTNMYAEQKTSCAIQWEQPQGHNFQLCMQTKQNGLLEN